VNGNKQQIARIRDSTMLRFTWFFLLFGVPRCTPPSFSGGLVSSVFSHRRRRFSIFKMMVFVFFGRHFPMQDTKSPPKKL